MPPVSPMLAKSVPEIPDVGHVEPKWDGFRTIVFRDGDEVVLGSRNERPMTRYFPEVVEAVLANTPRAVRPRRRDRRRPRRPARLRGAAAADPPRGQPGRRCCPRETPASLVAFDLLALGDDDLMARPFRERRERLVEAPRATPTRRCTSRRATADMALAPRLVRDVRGRRARRRRREAARRPLPARQARDVQDQARPDGGLRRRRLPLAQERAGRRLAAARASTGDDGSLQHVGVAASFPMARRKSLLDELAPYRLPEGGAAAAGHPWGNWADAQAHAGPADARQRLAVERRQGPLVRAAAARPRRRGRLRPDGGRPVPAHRAVPPVAHGPRRRSRARYEQLDRPVSYDLASVLTELNGRSPSAVRHRPAGGGISTQRERAHWALTSPCSTCRRYPRGAPHPAAHRVDPGRRPRHRAHLALRPGRRHPRPGGHRPRARSVRDQGRPSPAGRSPRWPRCRRGSAADGRAAPCTTPGAGQPAAINGVYAGQMLLQYDVRGQAQYGRRRRARPTWPSPSATRTASPPCSSRETAWRSTPWPQGEARSRSLDAGDGQATVKTLGNVTQTGPNGTHGPADDRRFRGHPRAGRSADRDRDLRRAGARAARRRTPRAPSVP